MSEYEDSEIDIDEQSEDGEIKKSPSKKSPLTFKDKENDDNAFSLSSEEEADTADSLDIKPPQAAVHHKDRSSGRKRDKSDRERRSRKESHRSKSHHRPREHREHRDRDDRHREKRHHRERREARESRREARDIGRDRGSSSTSKDKDRGDISGLSSSGPLIMEDLRERLDREKRRAAMAAASSSSGGSMSRKDERGRGGDEQDMGGRRRDEERRTVREHEAPLPPPPPRETQREKAERVEKEKRRERLLIADREMERQKEVYRRELEARRERRLEQQAQERTLRELARQEEQSREKMKTSKQIIIEKSSRGMERKDKGEAMRGEEEEEDDEEEDEEEDDEEEEEEEDSEEEQRSSSERGGSGSPSHINETEAVNLVTEDEEEEDEKMVVGSSGMQMRKGRMQVEEEEEGVWDADGGAHQSGDSGSEEEDSSGGDSNSSTDTDEDADTDDSRHKGEEASPDSKQMSKMDVERRRGGHSGATNGDVEMMRMEVSSSRKRLRGAEEDGEDESGIEVRRRRGERRRGRVEDGGGREQREDVDGDGIPYVNDESPKSDVVLRDEGNGEEEAVEEPEEEEEEEEPAVEEQEELPPYLPAIQGCRNVEEFQCLNRIEEGTYGIVYRARDKRTDEIVALKRLKMEKEKEGFPITSLREINTLLKAQHPNIVTVREIVVGSNMDKIFIVMDYVEHDLKSLMETMKQRKQVFIPGEVKCLMEQLLRAVAHLHDNWILHRDLKTSNLLLSHKGILKVGDFGLAREYGSPLKPYTPIVVTLWYRSPELLLCTKEYSTPVDMWSVGCIFGEFISMEPLFQGKSEIDLLNKIFKDLGTPNERIWPGYNKLPAVQKMTFAEYPVSQMRSRFGAMLTDLGLDLLNRFLTYDPAQRITAEDALRHEYFKEAPVAIKPDMFPTWPAKSELGHRKAPASPKPPSGGREYKQLGDTDDDVSVSGGFHMGVMEKGRAAIGAGFSLKF